MLGIMSRGVILDSLGGPSVTTRVVGGSQAEKEVWVYAEVGVMCLEDDRGPQAKE